MTLGTVARTSETSLDRDFRRQSLRQFDSRLQEIIDAWPGLTETGKHQISSWIADD